MNKSIKELKNKHLKEDIWIILAGSSMDYVSQEFFDNKIVIGVNQVYKHYKCDYIVMKDCMEVPRYTRSINQLQEKNIPLIYSEYYKGDDEIEVETLKVRNYVMEKYNCNIHSLNPFLNFSLEEHKFTIC